jgi:radical SAM superfamily enzyme YgiQ (UPF0313 family)
MKVLFIRPHLFDGRSSDALEPLAFAALAGVTPPDVDIALSDERLAPVPFDAPADLVAISVETYTARRAYQIAARFRSRNIRVVLGGYHPTFVPDEALLHADAVVSGDAEPVWPDVLRDARRGHLQRLYRASQEPTLDGIVFDRRIFRELQYPPIAPVQIGRGCRYACDFCSIHSFYGSRVRCRPVGDVAREIEALDRRDVLFVDDNLFINRAHAKELFQALIPLNIRWGCQVSIDLADDLELLDLMAESGCMAALVGFESLDADNLRQMNKGWTLQHQTARAAVDRFHDRGIMVYGSFIFGYDGETGDSIRRTVDFALDSRLFLANISPLTPMPGSRLFDRLRAEGRLLYDRWWLDDRYRYGDIVYTPARMDPDELAARCVDARRDFYAYTGIARRLSNLRANARTVRHLALFLAANVVSRREISSKVGRPLGAAEPGVTPCGSMPVPLSSP